MVTSRTGTTRWLRVRKQRLDHDRDAGLIRCPRCKVGLDWEYTRRPNSPEPDHIISHKAGGEDSFENTMTICRRCNQQLGDKIPKEKKTIPVIVTVELPSSGIW